MPTQKKNRQPKQSPSKSPTSVLSRFKALDIAVIAISVVLIAIGLWASTHRPKDSLACEQPGKDYQVTLSGDSFSPQDLTVQRCDRIITINKGDQSYELVFGSHENLGSYPGFSQQPLAPGEYFELDAVQAGTFVLHDHLHNKAYLHLQINDR